MSVYKRGDIYQVELRKRGFDRVRLSTGTKVKASAEKMSEALKWIMDRGRRDLLSLVLDGRLLLADLVAAYERNRSELDHLLAKADSPPLGELVDEWLDWMKSPAGISGRTRNSFAPSTLHRYESSWAKLFCGPEQRQDDSSQ